MSTHIILDDDGQPQEVSGWAASEIIKLRKKAMLWDDLVSWQKFNNQPRVGYAINRTKERVEKRWRNSP